MTVGSTCSRPNITGDVIAPDFIGFGHSDAPSRDEFRAMFG
ncbi:hypothetical protein ACNI65_24880 [Roseateles sp. So40a]